MQLTMTGRSASTLVRDGAGRVISMFSNDPWYRYLRALADLFIVGEIDSEEMSDRIRHDHPENYACIAARHVLGSIYLALDEPECLHRGNVTETVACDCPSSDRRTRLRELIGA